MALAASPFVFAACGGASAEDISDTIKAAYDEASSVTQMDSITCNSDLDATVGATTTCTAMTSEGDAPAEVSCDVTGTDADGAELATSYTASLTNEAEFSAEPTA